MSSKIEPNVLSQLFGVSQNHRDGLLEKDKKALVVERQRHFLFLWRLVSPIDHDLHQFTHIGHSFLWRCLISEEAIVRGCAIARVAYYSLSIC